MYNKFLQMIRQAYYSVVDADTSEFPKGQVTSNGKATEIVRMSTYGVFGNAPKDSHVLMFQSQGQESVKFGFFNDFLNRKKGLKEGECGLYNTLTGAIVFMKEDGSILVESNSKVDVKAPETNVEGDVVNVNATTSANVTAPAIVLNGAVTINGTLIVSGAVGGASGAPLSAPNGVVIGGLDLGTHFHNLVQPGTGNSGGPQ